MPVEIRELIIRAYVEANSKKELTIQKDSSNEEVNNLTPDDIAQMLEVINSKNER